MQSHFTGSSMYNTGGQAAFGSPGFGGAMVQGTQNFGGQAGGQQGFYPNWFAQYTGRQPMQIDQLIQMQFQQTVNNLFSLQMVQQLMAGMQNNGELPALLTKVRTYAFVLMLDKSSPAVSQPTDVIVQRMIEVVLFGEIVRRVGGPHMPFVKTLSDAVRMDVADLFNTYNMFETSPNLYQTAVHNVENQIRAAMQQQQQSNPFGGGFTGGGFGGQVHPAAQAAVPSANFGAYLNQGQQPTNTFGGQIASPGTQPTNDTINQIGRVANGGSASIYAIALQNDQTRHVQEQQIVEQRNAENREAAKLNIPADNVRGVTDAFSLAAMIQREGLKAITPVVEEPIPEQIPVVEPTPEPQPDPAEVQQKPRAVIPAAWSNKHAGRLEDPIAEYTTPPTTGLPSLGFYNMAAGEKTTMDDFHKQATPEQHTDHAPIATRTFDDEAGRLDEDDDFLNAVEQQIEADIQSLHEAERRENPIHATSSMDDLVKQGQEQNLSTNIEDQELRIDFNGMDSKSRKNICKQFHIRVVPAYVKGHDRVIQIMKGKRRTIVVERVDNVKYEEHETEVLNSTPVFATWDAAARDMGSAKNVMAEAAAKPVWSSADLLEKLDQKLKDSDNPDDAEIKLSELLAERSIIQIEGALTSSSPQGDYQGEVVTELTERGVEQAGTILDNAIVEYERFETACLAIQDDNESLIEAIHESKTVIELIGALNNFRKNSTLPVREISRLHHSFTKYLNQYLKVEFSNGWNTTDPIEDQDDLTRALLQSYAGELSAHDVMIKLNDIYTAAAQKAYRLVGIDADVGGKTVGNLHTVVLLPIYYSQYPLATLDDVGAIQKVDHPELYELLSKVYSEGKDIKIVTLDNYALTFVRSLGDDDLFYLVEVTN